MNNPQKKASVSTDTPEAFFEILGLKLASSSKSVEITSVDL